MEQGLAQQAYGEGRGQNTLHYYAGVHKSKKQGKKRKQPQKVVAKRNKPVI